jgi:hypothetical protein
MNEIPKSIVACVFLVSLVSAVSSCLYGLSHCPLKRSSPGGPTGNIFTMLELRIGAR